MTSGSDKRRLRDLTPRLHGVEVMVVWLDDFRGHDPAHEENGPWERKGQRESDQNTHIIYQSEISTLKYTHIPVLRFLMTKKNGWSAMTCGYSTRVLVRAIIPERKRRRGGTNTAVIFVSDVSSV